MDFFEEDEPVDGPSPGREVGRTRRSGAPPPEGPGNVSNQQILTRRLILAGVSIVVLILLFLAFKGCLDARKDRAFKNYVSDLSALTVETKQLSDAFFGALNGESESGDISLTNEVNGNRGTAQGLLDRAENLDAPDQVSSAQSQIVLTYRLRRDALEEIANQLNKAQGDVKPNKAIKAIVGLMGMEAFLGSDVLYARGQSEIEQALIDEEIVIDGGVPDSKFLPTGNKDPDYLDADTVAGLISSAGTGTGSTTSGGDSANCDPGDGLTHGLGLVSTTVLPGGTVLQPGATASVPAADAEFEVAVANQGEAPESDIKVTLSGDLSGTQTIDTIAAAETQTVTIVPKQAPSAGESATLTVTVDTVCGEQVGENNVSEPPYQITFE